MKKWKPERTKTVLFAGRNRKVGVDGYRFYIFNESTEEWDSFMEYKHDGNLASAFADTLWHDLKESNLRDKE